MTITQPSKRDRSDDFAAASPDAKPAAIFRGKRLSPAFTLPPEIIAGIDAMAAEKTRSMAKMIEIIPLRFLQMREGRHREAV